MGKADSAAQPAAPSSLLGQGLCNFYLLRQMPEGFSFVSTAKFGSSECLIQSNPIQWFCFQAPSMWSSGTQVPCPGGMNSSPDNFCRVKSGEKASGGHEGIHGNNIWQVWLFGLTHQTGFVISQTQTANWA